jgi:hypothetical protein
VNEGGKSDHPEDRFAVLVDGHEGTRQGLSPREGTLLQHPVFSSMFASNEAIQVPRIEEDMLEKLKGSEGTFQYVDPVSMSNDPRGDAFAGKWIASMARVDISRRISDSQERKQSTDLWVLVQERADSITGPVDAMSSQLFHLGRMAILTLIAVISILWIVVLWVLRLPDSFVAAVRSRAGGGTEITGTANEATLDAER